MEKFRKGRMPSDIELLVETGDGPVLAKVVDVNEYGMRLFGALNVRRGEDITATLKSWEISGVVRWAKRPYCGILFDSRAPDEAMTELRGISNYSTNMTSRLIEAAPKKPRGPIRPVRPSISATSQSATTGR